jgi:transcriptional regulator with XRE-family HTH domain
MSYRKKRNFSQQKLGKSSMKPRKKESKKWSQIPPELSKQIKDVFEENFKTQLAGKILNIEGRIYPTEILMRLGINNKGELRFQNFEVSVDHSHDKQNTIAQIHLAVDVIASLLFDFFENDEDHEIPLIWTKYPFEKENIWLQYNSVNPNIEAEADRLLGLEPNDESLLQETEDDMEAYGLLDDEEVDTSRPKIFRVPTDNKNDSKKKKKKEDMH